MTQLLSYNATVVTPVTDGVAIPVPQTPAGVGLAQVNVVVPVLQPNNFVQLTATIGVRGDANVGSVLFRVFRDGREIYYARQGIESGFEEFALITLQAVDVNPPAGQHGYTVSIEKLTAGFTATVIGPLNLTASVINS